MRPACTAPANWVDRGGRQRTDAALGVFKQTQVVTPEQTWETTLSGQVETMSSDVARGLIRDQALRFADPLRGGHGARAALMAPEMRDGQSWAVVRISFGDDDIYDAFIDAKTGALQGYRITEDRKTRFDGFGDWRMVDGVRMPFLQTTKTEQASGDTTLKVAEMVLNQPVEAVILARPNTIHKAEFADGASSSGWIDFEFFAGNRIYFPAKVNGHDTVVLLDSGAQSSVIDKTYAKSIGLESEGSVTANGTGGTDTAGLIAGVKIEVGGLTLRDINVVALDLAQVAKGVGHPLPFVLGDELFNEAAVDIDFANRASLSATQPNSTSRRARPRFP